MSLPAPSESSTALVTGASSEIGTDIARALACRGHGVVLVARRAERLDGEREAELVRLNCETVVALCGRFVPAMVERGAGAVLNVASTAGFQPLPTQATYSASRYTARPLQLALTRRVYRLGDS